MINLPQGFKVGAAEAVDSRLTLSKTEMLAIKDSLMPAVYLAVCKDDNAIYIFISVTRRKKSISISWNRS